MLKNLPDVTTVQGVSVGKCVNMEGQGEVVKDFMVGKAHIKINDAYCRGKTPADVQRILSGIADRVQEQITAQEAVKTK